jgi:hypothetical protein
MTDMRREAINIDLFIHTKQNSKPEPFSESTPVVRNIQFSHIRGNAHHRSVELKGLEESPLENIKLSNIEIVAPNGLTANNTKNLELIEFSNQSVK